MLRAFHDGMSARVTVGGHESDPFDVLAGVKQGCVVAPVILNLFLVAVTLVFRNGLLSNAGSRLAFSSNGPTTSTLNTNELKIVTSKMCVKTTIKA